MARAHFSVGLIHSDNIAKNPTSKSRNGNHIPQHRYPRPAISIGNIIYPRHWGSHLQRPDLRVDRRPTATIRTCLLAAKREGSRSETDAIGAAASEREERGCSVGELAAAGWEYGVGEGNEN